MNSMDGHLSERSDVEKMDKQVTATLETLEIIDRCPFPKISTGESDWEIVSSPPVNILWQNDWETQPGGGRVDPLALNTYNKWNTVARDVRAIHIRLRLS